MLQTNLNGGICVEPSTITLSTSTLKPQAYIAVNKNRVKRYECKAKTLNQNECIVYLSGNTEFQIEIFNPTQDVYLAKINMNGKPISNSGVVINPGQRIFLDRFIDQNSKFLFKTYDVSGKNEEVKMAIEKNGLVEIEFYKETISYKINYYYDGPMQSPYDGQLFHNYYYDGPMQSPYNEQLFHTTIKASPKTFTDGQVYGIINNAVQTCAYNSRNLSDSTQIETGRVEKGSASSQSFERVNKDFSLYSEVIETIKILPESQRIYTSKDLFNHRKYCPNCGKKVGQKDKFCSNCGKKL